MTSHEAEVEAESEDDRGRALAARRRAGIESGVRRALETGDAAHLALADVAGALACAEPVPDTDLTDALALIAATRRRTEMWEAELLRAARAVGPDGKPRMTWRRIGDLLGTTPQGAQDLHRRRVGVSLSDTPRVVRAPSPVTPDGRIRGPIFPRPAVDQDGVDVG